MGAGLVQIVNMPTAWVSGVDLDQTLVTLAACARPAQNYFRSQMSQPDGTMG